MCRIFVIYAVIIYLFCIPRGKPGSYHKYLICTFHLISHQMLLPPESFISLGFHLHLSVITIDECLPLAISVVANMLLFICFYCSQDIFMISFLKACIVFITCSINSCRINFIKSDPFTI